MHEKSNARRELPMANTNKKRSNVQEQATKGKFTVVKVY
jgi:hypothetical protein